MLFIAPLKAWKTQRLSSPTLILGTPWSLEIPYFAVFGAMASLYAPSFAVFALALYPQIPCLCQSPQNPKSYSVWIYSVCLPNPLSPQIPCFAAFEP